MNRRIALIALLALASLLPAIPRAQQEAAPVRELDPAVVKAFQWRSIGPLRGGRSIAIAGVKGRPKEGYFGATLNLPPIDTAASGTEGTR